jgi:ornithine carbamoyltransferase
MKVDLQGRSFLSMLDLTTDEIHAVLETARQLKAGGPAAHGTRLAGKALAMIFQKPSLRTRVSFEVGMQQLGGQALYLAPADIKLGARETTEDIALVLSRYVDVIMARVFGHDVVSDLARHATVPVINGLSDLEHPCQILGDLLTILEHRQSLEGRRACFIGDGNNVAHSLMLGAARMGMHMTIVCPPGFEPQASITEQATEIGAASGGQIQVTNELSGVAGAEILYTDVWASMGQEEEAARRRHAFEGYRIDATTVQAAAPSPLILHCLPAHYDEEIDYATSRLPSSAIFDQAENRMHAQKALLVHLLGAA